MAVSAINPSPASVVHGHAPTGAQTGGTDHPGGRPSRAHPFRTGSPPPPGDHGQLVRSLFFLKGHRGRRPSPRVRPLICNRAGL